MSLKNNAILVSALALSAVAFAVPASAQEAYSWMVRGRVLGVVPAEDATVTVLGGNVKIDNSIVPELDLTYFFTKNWAVEAIAAVTPHNVTSTVAGDLGNVWLLPPTVTLQYHLPIDQHWKPYVGAGVNYTHFFNENAQGAATDINYKDSFGFALQGGVDYMLNDKWSLNLDVKKIFLNSHVAINAGAINANVDIDPWLIGVGVGYRF